MDIDFILKKPAFSSLSPEQRAAFKDLITKLNNKTVAEAMPVMLSFMANMPKSEPLPPEAQAAMTEAVMESLNESEKSKFKALLSLYGPKK